MRTHIISLFFSRYSKVSTFDLNAFRSLSILCFAVVFSGSALSKPLIIGIAPSLPSPIAELEVIEEPTRKKWQKKPENKTAPSLNSSSQLPTKEQAWRNVFTYITDESGVDLKFEPAKGQLEFELKLAKGYYDLAYATPLQFNAFRDFPGYQAQVKRKSQPLRGMIFVKKNGPITTLADLRGSTIAFPGLLNFPGSVMPRESLHRLKFDIIPQFLPSQNIVYSEVAKGQHIAGGGTSESFRAQPPEIQNSLRVIWDTPGFTPHALIAHPRVDFFSLVRLKKAFVGMIKNETGKELLPHIFVDNGFEVARNSDWDEIRLINLEQLNGDPESTEAPEPERGM